MATNPDRGAPPKFGELLRGYRVSAGLTQEALAEKAGLSARGLSDLERGLRRRPHAETVRRFVAALGLHGEDQSRFEACALAPLPPKRSFSVPAASASSDWPDVETGSDHAFEAGVQLTSFVGRDGEVAEVQRLLRTTRLLTLVGPGGIGKTRLAYRIARLEAHQAAGSVRFVDLAPITDASLVPQTVAVALGLREQQGVAVMLTIADAVRNRPLLLVLDNCEHLLQACRDLVAALLRACAQLRILTTSRAVLGVPGETIWSVPPLGLPDARRDLLDEVRRSEAAALFMQRARNSRPGFVLDEHTAPAVAAICRAVDGLPLGIELAAARLRVLAVDQIAERLQSALTLLVGGPPTAAPRHQTLRAALDWSYDLLSEQERRVFERTSVFSGGWTVEAAEVVCLADGAERSRVLDLLGQLVDQSLVVADPADDREMRFRLLEPIRQYAAERLERCGDAQDARRRHAAHYTNLVDQLGFQWSGRDRSRLARLEVEHDNARTALRWMIDRGQAEPALQLGGAAAYFWQQRGYASEGRAWLSEILALPGSSNSLARARALTYASTLVAEQGDYGTARPMVDEALAITRECGHGPTLAFVLFRAAQLTWFRREFAAARDLADEGVRVGQAVGLRNLEGINLWQSAQATHDLGECAAEASAERAVAIFEELENPTMLACALTTLAQIHLGRGNLTLARQLLDRAVATHPPDFQGVAQMFSNVNLGWVTIEQGDLAGAQVAFLAALRMALEALGARARLVTPLEGLAQLAAAAGQPWRALCLAGAAARLRRDYATPPTPTEIRQLDRWLERARAELGGPNAEAAVALGECFSAEEAVAEALALDVTQQVPSCRPTEVRATATAEPEASRCRGSRFPAAS